MPTPAINELSTAQLNQLHALDAKTRRTLCLDWCDRVLETCGTPAETLTGLSLTSIRTALAKCRELLPQQDMSLGDYIEALPASLESTINQYAQWVGQHLSDSRATGRLTRRNQARLIARMLGAVTATVGVCCRLDHFPEDRVIVVLRHATRALCAETWLSSARESRVANVAEKERQLQAQQAESLNTLSVTDAPTAGSA